MCAPDPGAHAFVGGDRREYLPGESARGSGVIDGVCPRTFSYLRRIADRPLDFVDSEAARDFDLLEQWNDEAGVLWEEVLAAPIDVERVLHVDDNTRETRPGIFIAQAINHANHHREQVCAILTGFR